MAREQSATDKPQGRERVSPRLAVRRRWRLVVAIAAGIAILALIAGFARSPTYTAQAELNVGRLDVTTSAVPGFVSSVQALAATYSRLAAADAVTQAVATATGADGDEIDGTIRASPIADSPLIRLEATADSADEAIERANSASAALADYVGSLNSENPVSESLLDSYREASTVLVAARARLASAQRVAAANPTTANSAAVSDAEVEVAAAQLQVDNYSRLYTESQQGRLSANVITVYNPASRAESDRMSSMQQMLFIGLVAGLLLGIAAATALENAPAHVRAPADRLFGRRPPRRTRPQGSERAGGAGGRRPPAGHRHAVPGARVTTRRPDRGSRPAGASEEVNPEAGEGRGGESRGRRPGPAPDHA